jgi:hypothetical protein
MCGRTEVTFVDTLPYHIALGADVSMELSNMPFSGVQAKDAALFPVTFV